MHRLTIITVLAVPFALLAAPVNAGWNGAEWEMTPLEVEAATSGFARATRENLPRENSRARVGNRAEFENELSRFEVEYRFTHLGLAEIELTPEFDDCQAVMQSFIESFGQPEYREQAILRTFVWIDVENDNRIVLLHSTARICDFTFTSLSRFNGARAEASQED